MSARKTRDEYFLAMLELVADRSTCPRRNVGAIITDVRGVILATGYNGVPRGFKHCTDTPCPGANDVSGDLSRCQAVHAEQNALLQCSQLDHAHTIYVSCLPCITCAKLILNTYITRVVAAQPYTTREGLDMLKLGKVMSVYVRDELLYYRNEA